MPVYMNGKKVKDLYYGGRKIKEAWYQGKKVYSSFTLPPQWEASKAAQYQPGDEVYAIFGPYYPGVYLFRRTSTEYNRFAHREADLKPSVSASGARSTVFWEHIGTVQTDPFPPEGYDSRLS